MDISTDSLKTFIAVCEWKSFSLAAGCVNKSQAAISIQIAKLEEQAGTKFIDRSRRSFTLTEAGDLFLRFAKNVVKQSEDIHRSLQDLKSGYTDRVRIGTTRSVGTLILTEIIQGISNELPKFTISLLAQSPTTTYDFVRKGELDFAVVLSDAAPDDLDARSLRSELLCFVVSAKHPIARASVVSLEMLKNIPFITGITGNDYSDMIDRLLIKNRIAKPPSGLTISNLQGRKEAACHGAGFTIMPRFAIQDELRNKVLSTLRIKDIPTIETSLLLVESPRHLGSGGARFVKEIFEKRLSGARKRSSETI